MYYLLHFLALAFECLEGADESHIDVGEADQRQIQQEDEVQDVAVNDVVDETVAQRTQHLGELRNIVQN